MTQTQAEIQSERDASQAEHERLSQAVQQKPISQVFIEEAEREIRKLEISPDTKAGVLLMDYLVTSYEKTHHSLCKSMANASSMGGTTEGMAVGCIRGTNGRWRTEIKILPLSAPKQTVSQMFHDAALDTVSRVRDLDMSSDHASDLVTGLINRFENHFYTQIKASEQSGQSLDPHETAQSIVEFICNDYE